MTKHEPMPETNKRPEEDRREPEQIDPAHRASVEAGLTDWRAGRFSREREKEAPPYPSSFSCAK